MTNKKSRHDLDAERGAARASHAIAPGEDIFLNDPPEAPETSDEATEPELGEVHEPPPAEDAPPAVEALPWDPEERVAVEPPRALYWAACTADAPHTICLGGTTFQHSRGQLAMTTEGRFQLIRGERGTFVRLSEAKVELIRKVAAERVLRPSANGTATLRSLADRHDRRTNTMVKVLARHGDEPVGRFAVLVGPLTEKRTPRLTEAELEARTLIARPAGWTSPFWSAKVQAASSGETFPSHAAALAAEKRRAEANREVRAQVEAERLAGRPSA